MRGSDQAAGQAGFTLLEILLVIVIMAVTAMMVIPNYIGSAAVSLRDEGERLAGVLRLATEEAELSGTPIRLRMRRHSYLFQAVDSEGVWQAMSDSVYQPHQLGNGFTIAEVRPATALSEQEHPTTDQQQPPVIAELLLLPEGFRRVYDIQLADDRGRSVTVQLRPGPAGIAVTSDDAAS